MRVPRKMTSRPRSAKSSRNSCSPANGTLRPGLTPLVGGSPKSWTVSGMATHPQIYFFRDCPQRIMNRTFYDGKRFISRLGNPYVPPKWFLDSACLSPPRIYLFIHVVLELPKNVTLDGELFGGRGQFQSTVSIVKSGTSPHWKEITFKVIFSPRLPFPPCHCSPPDFFRSLTYPHRVISHSRIASSRSKNCSDQRVLMRQNNLNS